MHVPPYDGPDRPAKLKARLDELNSVIDGQPDDIPDQETLKGLPAAPWSIDEYLQRRVEDQIAFYTTRAREFAAP